MFTYLESLWQDSIYAYRQFRLSPGFVAVASLTLALAIGVNTSIFSLLNALLLRPLPVNQPYRLVTLLRGDSRPCSYPDYLDFRDRNRVFSGLAADVPNETAIDVGDSSEITMVESVSYNYPDVVETKAVLGRWFSVNDESRAPGDFQVVISYRIWQVRYGGDPNVLGRRLRLESQPYTIIGVAAKDLQGMSPPILTDAWVPIAAYARHNDFAARVMHDRLSPDVMLIGRLKPGVTREEAQAAMNIIDRSLQREYLRPKSRPEPLRAEVVRGISDPDNRRNASQLVMLLAVVVALVLVIGCANVANLLLAHGMVRRREIAIRTAVGASRTRIVRQCLVESVLLASLGTLLGLVTANWMNRYLEARIASVPLIITIGARLPIDGRVLVFACAATIVTTLLFGVLPALQTSKPDLVPALHGEASAGRSSHRWFAPRNLCVLAQIIVSLMLLIVSGLFVRALHNATVIDPGFDPQHLLSLRLYLAKPAFTESTGLVLYDRALDLVRSMPGVRNATLSYSSPVLSSTECVANIPAPGRPADALIAGSNTVGTNYFATLGIPLLTGRDFTPADTSTAPPVAIINQTVARTYFPRQSPVGMRIRVGQGCAQGAGSELEIVGVAKDARYAATRDALAKPYVFFPLAQHYAGYTALLVRTGNAPAALAPVIRKKLLDLDTRLRIYEVIGLKQQMDDSLWEVRWEAGLVTGFGILALILATVGLYGVISSVVAQRTRELGIRMALGAKRHQVLRVIMNNALILTGIGILMGLLAAMALTRVLRGLLYGLSPTDPVTFLVAVLLWICIAAIASYIPARRAVSINPLETLRHQ